MEELRTSSIVMSTKDKVLLPIGEEKYQLAFGAAENFFACVKLRKNKYSLLHNCVTLSVLPHETSYQHFSSEKQSGASACPTTLSPFLQILSFWSNGVWDEILFTHTHVLLKTINLPLKDVRAHCYCASLVRTLLIGHERATSFSSARTE